MPKEASKHGLYEMIKCPVCEGHGELLITRNDVLAGAELSELAGGVISTMAEMYGVTSGDLVGDRKFKRLIEPRALCYWTMRERLGMTLQGIATIFNRDHSTIIHALGCVSVSGVYEAKPHPRTIMRHKAEEKKTW